MKKLLTLLVCLSFTACRKDASSAIADASTLAPKILTHIITFKNFCTEDIWVGSVGQNGSPSLMGGGWKMSAGSELKVGVPVGHSGRVWPRTDCKFNDSGNCPSDAGNCCATGGCLEADNKTFGLACGFTGAAPASLLEWTLDAPSGNGPIDYYDMSLVDGWSVPMRMDPVAGTYNVKPDPGIGSWWCEQDGCQKSPICPDAYKVPNSPLSCLSPCQAAIKAGSADSEKLCCTCSLSTPVTCPDARCAGHYGCTPYHTPAYPQDMQCNPWDSNPDRAWDAKAISYIEAIHTACPKVYAWQFDDMKSTFNCRKTGGQVDYIIQFCPPSPSSADAGN